MQGNEQQSRQLRLWIKPVSLELDKDQAEIVYTSVGGESNKTVAKQEPTRKKGDINYKALQKLPDCHSA